jgi:hypothetical protein
MTGADTLIAFATAGTALITSLCNGIVLIIKAIRDREVAGAVSNDLTTIATSSPHVDASQLETPRLIPPGNNHATTPAAGAGTPPDRSPG